MRLPSLLLLCLAIPYAHASAQAPALETGARLRVTAPAYGAARHPATLVALRGDSLVLRIGRFDSLAVPRSAISSLEVSTGRRRHIGRGLGRGFLVGLGLGVAIGLADGDDASGFFAMSAGEKALAGGVLLGATGAVLGGLYGAVPQDQWERVDPSTVEARLILAPHGAGLALSTTVRF